MRRSPDSPPQPQAAARNDTGSPDLRRTAIVAVVAGLVPLLALLALFAFDVPIGQPFFLIYRYSPLVELRIVRALAPAAVGLGTLAILYRAFQGENGAPRSAIWIAALGYAALVVWSFVGPPQYVTQHSFNLVSPSHDGAFVLEGRTVESVREYVSKSCYERLERSPEEMRGRRVLSNPPGVTVASVLVHRTVYAFDGLRAALVAGFGLQELEESQQRADFAAALLLGVVFTVAWGLAVVVAYHLCRLWMPVSAAMCVSFACVFNPATLNFSPGKDPAQLLTVLAILWGWLRAYQAGTRWVAVVSGIALAAGCAVGLVHLWIAIIVGGATLWHARAVRRDIRSWLWGCTFPALAGIAGTVVVLYVTMGWNLPLTVYRVADRYGEIQLPIITDPFHWTLVGLPMFLLFVGPLFWAQVVATRPVARNPLGDLGGALLACTVGVMTYTYFFANNSETPRLWIPFIPLLLVGLAIRRRWFVHDTPDARRLHVVLLVLQLGVTLAHWSLMDARESEWRITTGRMWD